MFIHVSYEYILLAFDLFFIFQRIANFSKNGEKVSAKKKRARSTGGEGGAAPLRLRVVRV